MSVSVKLREAGAKFKSTAERMKNNPITAQLGLENTFVEIADTYQAVADHIGYLEKEIQRLKSKCGER